VSVSFLEHYGHGARVSQTALATGAVVAEWIPQPSAENSGYGATALWWATYVGKVFPLSMASADAAAVSAGKVPHALLGRGWTAEDVASSDPAQIREWWTSAPLANVGIAVKTSGLLILDVDPRHGGWGALDVWAEAQGVALGDVPRSVSPRGDGGAHLWWKLPCGATYPHSPLVKGVDRPWQVPVPPSMRWVVVDGESRDPARVMDYRPYTWLAGNPLDLPVAPEALLSAGVGSAGPEDGEGGDARGFGEGLIGSGVADAIARGGVRVPVGEQSYTFKRVACSMFSRGYPVEQVVAALMASAEASEVGDEAHPWLERELRLMAEQADAFIKRSRDQEASHRNTYWASRQNMNVNVAGRHE